jgi:glycosyltransferase involved in cell wall biosynthesis
VSFEGYCDGKRLAELYRNAAFVVVPSEWYENAPMTVLEAFAYGKPVIGTAVGGIPELLTDGETGYLVMPGDAAQMRAAAVQLWRAQLPQKVMGINARKLVEKRYSQGRRTETLLEIYASLCNPHPELLRCSASCHSI